MDGRMGLTLALERMSELLASLLCFFSCVSKTSVMPSPDLQVRQPAVWIVPAQAVTFPCSCPGLHRRRLW